MPLEQQIDKLLFHLKHWQIFMVYMAILFVESVVELNIFPIFVLLHLGLLGIRLKRFLPESYREAYTIFLIALAMLVVGIAHMLIAPPETNSIVALISGIIYLVAFFIVPSFIARAIKSLETHDRATVNDYFLDILWVFMFFPLGVWFSNHA